MVIMTLLYGHVKTLYIIHLILTTVLGGKWYYCSNFTYEEIEAFNLTKAIQIARGRIGT